MKTKEELNALKEEVEAVNKKLQELTDEELVQVFGGADPASPYTMHVNVGGHPTPAWINVTAPQNKAE